MTRALFIPIQVITILVAACGGAAHPSGPTTFKDMDLDQRIEFMKSTVLPRAKQLFVAFDPKFEKMDCETCHGDGAKNGTWELPNPKIKPLPNSPEGFTAWMQAAPDEARWAKFMATQLVPEMARMLGKKQFDPQTKTGDFGCSVCHVLSADAGK